MTVNKYIKTQIVFILMHFQPTEQEFDLTHVYAAKFELGIYASMTPWHERAKLIVAVKECNGLNEIIISHQDNAFTVLPYKIRLGKKQFQDLSQSNLT